MQSVLKRLDAGVSGTWVSRLLHVGLAMSVVAFFALMPGCEAEPTGGGDGEPRCAEAGEACNVAADCCDDLVCTDGVCAEAPVDLCAGVECPEGEECDPATGECVEIPPEDLCEGVVCDDDDLCTTDECDPATGECVFTDVACDAGQACDPETGECVAAPCEAPEDCDDEDLCTTDDCVDGACVFTAVECDEGEECNPDTGECEPVPVPGNHDLEADNPDVDFGALTEGTAVTLFAPRPAVEAQASDDDCDCTWSVDGDGAFDPADGCETEYTPALTDTLITVGVTCDDGTEGTFLQDVTVSEAVPPEGLTITISGCPEELAQGGTADLTAAYVGEEGTVEVTWEVTVGSGTLDVSTDGLAATFTSTGPADATIVATATDTVITDFGTDGVEGGDDDTTETFTDTDECAIDIRPPSLAVSAGADIAPPATAGAFTNGTTVVYGTLVAPVVVAIADDSEFEDLEISYTWEVTGWPTGSSAADVVILNVASPNLAFNLLPIGTANELQLLSTGQTTTLSNVAIPGVYEFTVTATNPAGDTVDDAVNITCAPAFQLFTRWDDDADADDIDTVFSRAAGVNDTLVVPAASAGVQAAALQGMVLKSGEGTNYVTGPTSVDITFTMLARANGTLSFSAQNLDGGATTALNSVEVMADTTQTQEVVCNVAALTAGTYIINATFSTTTGSTGALATDAVVHVQADLPTSVNCNSNTVVTGLGVVTSDAAGPGVHGAFEASAYAGNIVKGCDLNGDGIDELIVMDDNAGTPVVQYFFTTPNPGTGQINNSLNNEDDGNGRAFYITGAITFAVANTNAIWGTTANGLADAAAADPAAGDHVWSCACGDLDGDEFVDLAFGLEDASIGLTQGQVTILYHDGTTEYGQNYYNYSTAAATPKGARATIDGPAAAADGAVDELLFGYAMAAGKVYGSDTVDDLIIGAPGDGGDSDEGRIYLFNGSAIRYAGNVVATTGAFAGGGKERTGAAVGDFFGVSIAVGNITNGTQLDVIVGAPDDTALAGPGLVAVYANISDAGAENRSYTGDTVGDLFGRRIDVCSFNGATPDDIVVNASDGGVGRTYVILDGRSSFPDVGALTDVPQWAGAAGEEMGHLFACGDFDGDGFDDIAALTDDTGNKAVLVKGSATPSATLAIATTFTGLTGDAVGAAPEVSGWYDPENHLSINFVDVNGDNIMDLAISEPTAGTFRVIYGRNVEE